MKSYLKNLVVPILGTLPVQRALKKAIDVTDPTAGRKGLVALAIKYGTDKWHSHWYAQHYEKHFSHKRDDEIKLLEIGVGGYEKEDRGGASLRMWKEFFPKGEIFSLDIHDKSALEEPRIRIFKGSQNDSEFLRNVAGEIGTLDIIIDDGSHINEHVKKSFLTLFPLLAKDGIYAIEDTQTSYWEEYGGDSINLATSDTLMNFFKGLVDDLNYEEIAIRRPEFEPSYFAQNIVALHFYHNLIIVQKGKNKEGTTAARR
jgi:hypothetical protein